MLLSRNQKRGETNFKVDSVVCLTFFVTKGHKSRDDCRLCATPTDEGDSYTLPVYNTMCFELLRRDWKKKKVKKTLVPNSFYNYLSVITMSLYHHSSLSVGSSWRISPIFGRPGSSDIDGQQRSFGTTAETHFRHYLSVCHCLVNLCGLKEECVGDFTRDAQLRVSMKQKKERVLKRAQLNGIYWRAGPVEERQKKKRILPLLSNNRKIRWQKT